MTHHLMAAPTRKSDMKNKEIDELVDECASELLDALSRIVPDIQDDGAIGELILRRALETYTLVAEVNN